MPAGTATVAIRPEDIVLHDPDVGDAHGVQDALNLTVLEYSPLRHLLILDRAGTAVVVTTVAERNFSPGQSVGVSLPARSLLYFRADGRRIPT
jgi:multiple sugar transport system ATP-binding protein